ncbi:hypothetical protein P4B35_12325, partial [Pontiellaceae bacterium B12227]|nr:hypothetical protein [Pontiellaceae bacterium B12227]
LKAPTLSAHSRAFRALLLLTIMPAAWAAADVIPERLSYESARGALLQQSDRMLTFETNPKEDLFPSVLIHAPNGHWDLSGFQSLETTFHNTGNTAINIAFWAVGAPGWDAPVGTVMLEPGETKPCSIELSQRWKGGLVNKVDASHIEYLRVSLFKSKQGGSFEMAPVVVKGSCSPPERPEGYHRLEFTPMTEEEPAAGRRVRHQLKGFMGSELYHSLYLPADWKPGKTYPIIVEYAGNRWLNPPCHSIGRPEGSRMGFGMSEGKGYIWVNAPFVYPETKMQALNGWGDADATAQYAIDLVDMLCTDFGGDPDNVIITGFSRGAVACGYIGLRNDEISKLWKAFHSCQHYDGDGYGQATYESALNDRMPRINGRKTFHTDNGKHEKLQELFRITGEPVEFVESGIGAHTDTMFLENRPSTLRLREWLAETVTEK